MEFGLWAGYAVLLLVIIVLLVKIYMLRKSAEEIKEAFAERLMTDTNTLIDISTKDKYMCSMAESLNVQLRIFHEKRRRFEQGDIELKNAITNISHDLRTPLTAICGYLDLIRREELSASNEKYIDIIEERTKALKQLTEELFRYSILIAEEKQGKKENVVINEILEDSIAAFYAALKERGITPDIQITEQDVCRRLDRSALSRVLSNLINNAVKYSDGDLKIVLSETGEIIFENTASDLDEVQVGRLFDRFYTVEAARKSTGLGLSIARTLVEEMGGEIRAMYEDNRLSICVRI